MSEELSFVLECEERLVTIGGEAYVIRELTGKERDRYLTALSGRLRTTAGGKQSVKNFDGLQASLVAASIFKVDGSEYLPVTVDDVQGWPSSVSAALFDVARELSALGEDEDKDKDAGAEEND